MVAWLGHPLSDNGIQFCEKCGTRSRRNIGNDSTMGSGESTSCNAKKVSNVAPDLSTRKCPGGRGCGPLTPLKPRTPDPSSGLFLCTRPVRNPSERLDP